MSANGGSVFFFLGGRVDPAFYNENLVGPGRRDGGLLPGPLVKCVGDPAEGKDVAFISDVDYEHPALGAFRDPGFASLVGPSVTFKALWDVDVKPPAAVLIRQVPARQAYHCCARRPSAKAAFCSSPPLADRSWTNFPIRPAYLPWVRQLAAYLTQEPLNRDTFHLTGDVVRLMQAGTERPRPAARQEAGRPIRRDGVERGGQGYGVRRRRPRRRLHRRDNRPQTGRPVRGQYGELRVEIGLSRRPARRQSGRRPSRKVEAGLKKSRLANRPLSTFVDDAGAGVGGRLGRRQRMGLDSAGGACGGRGRADAGQPYQRLAVSSPANGSRCRRS